MNYVLVFLGGGLGAALRYGLNVTVPKYLGEDFPWHTLLINISGCLVMGLIAGALAFRYNLSTEWRLFLMTGILGGYTTFSAFALDFALLMQRGQNPLALLYALASVVGAVAACFGGLWLARMLLA